MAGLWGVTCYLFIWKVTAVLSGPEEDAAKWLEDLETRHNAICNENVVSSWTAGINITEETLKWSDDAGNKFTILLTEMQQEVLKRFPDWKNFKNKKIRRALKYLAIGGPANMSLARVEKMNRIASDMTTVYSKATVCKYKDNSSCSVTLKDMEGLLKSVKDEKELSYYWTAWHDKMSAEVLPETYTEFAGLLKEYANANGFKYQTGLWLSPYDEETEGWTEESFEKTVLELEEQVTPLYDILHAYVRMKLRKVPEFAGLLTKCGYIPAHIVGNMWSQEWTNLDPLTKPYPNAPSLDATKSMIEQGYTPRKMFEASDRFFKDLGLKGMTDKFWKNSVLERPNDGREMSCHATAWDTCQGKGNTDFRIRQCTKVDQHDFIVVHHEMGHVEYYHQYTHLDFPFRTGANPGFHEAIGDSLALAVLTPSHLQCKLNLDLGLGKEFCEQESSGKINITETDINYLYYVALDKLVFFPFASSMDTWRWDVFEDRVNQADYNKRWWDIRKYYQGIIPPSDRSSSKLFDPAAKFHIVTNVDYIRYFISHILQFQFYEAMCIAAGEYTPKDPKSKPLFQCDFSGNKKAGKLIESMMKLGFSHGWPDALEVMTGSRKMSVAPFKHYLQPVLDYMEKELKANGEVIGFADSCEALAIKRTWTNVNDMWTQWKNGRQYK